MLCLSLSLSAVERSRQRVPTRRAFSLVEMLVVISVIGILAAMLLPALNAAKVAGRQAACKNNLRQFGIGMHEYGLREKGQFCSGAFNWRHDGCVTEIGWVADMIKEGVPPGMMLCPGNTAKVSETFNDLLLWDTSTAGTCVDLVGSPVSLAPDGAQIINPCRQIVQNPLTPGSTARVSLVEQQIFLQHYNTNYAASWFLVRGGVLIDDEGNLASDPPECPATLKSRTATRGPLNRVHLDAARAPSSLIPLLADGTRVGILKHPLAHYPRGTGVTKSFTNGPVLLASMQAPTFRTGTPATGPTGWWKTWARDTLQDYRGFGAVHGGRCNILFADGSVRTYTDANSDGLMNNGFPATVTNGYSETAVDLPPHEVFSSWAIE